MPIAQSYIDKFWVRNVTGRTITLGDLVNVSIPPSRTIDLLTQPLVTKDKINQSKHLASAVSQGLLQITKQIPQGSSENEKTQILTDERAASAVATGIITGITSATSDYTLTTGDSVILVDASSDPVTITLPSASSYEGTIFRIKRISSGLNTVTVDCTNSDTIDGETYQILYENVCMTVISDGTNWYII